MKIQSKRNYVKKLNIDGMDCVRKHFYSLDAWRTELENHARIRKYMRTAQAAAAVPGVIVYEYMAYPHLLDILEHQEQSGYSEIAWRAFAQWLKNAAVSGLLPAEGNLRNFLWDEKHGEIIPVDLEHWKKTPFQECAAAIAAFLMEYRPSGSMVKQKACAILCDEWGLEAGIIENKRSELRLYRNGRPKSRQTASLILLAGGKSTRMGRSKAKLGLCGKTLLEHQLETAAMLGIDDILVSGPLEDTGCRHSIPDELAYRGPLGGIYSCMKRAKHEKCVVLGVDMPFVDAEMLCNLLASHEKSRCEITIPVHDGKIEPLAGVYNTVLHERIGALITEKGAPVRRLLDQGRVNYVDFDINELLWHNCNTPEAYAGLTAPELTQSILKNIQS